MARTGKQKYTADPHIAEIYDRTQAGTEDIELLKRLMGRRGPLRVFEPFCGTGRVAMALAKAGHTVVGLDESESMLARFRDKLARGDAAVRGRVRLIASPVFVADWPGAQDVVALCGNCFYEVNSSDEQRALVHRAAAALAIGGHVFIDNDDHPSADLAPAWRRPPGRRRRAFPSGLCEDGTRLEGSTETAWYDVVGRFVHYVRRLVVTHPDGTITRRKWHETCHPTTMAETLAWVEQAGLVVENTFGDRTGRAHGPASPRAIVWARRGQ